MISINLLTKQNKLTGIENKHGYQRERGGWINWKFGITMYTLLYIK